MCCIEVRGFGKLYFLFKERGWDNPKNVMLPCPMTAKELREELDIPAADVDVVFINRLIQPLSTPLQDGDRVAFVPPGVPTIHRFMLGFYGAKEEEKEEKEAREPSPCFHTDFYPSKVFSHRLNSLILTI